MTKRRILLVDDEVDFMRLLQLNLERTQRYEVRAVSDSALAVREARAFQPEVIFLDLMMPGVGGDEIAEQFEADPVLQKIPIVFLTAVVTAEETAGRQGLIGGHAFLAKPAALAEVEACIERCLGTPPPEGR